MLVWSFLGPSDDLSESFFGAKMLHKKQHEPTKQLDQSSRIDFPACARLP